MTAAGQGSVFIASRQQKLTTHSLGSWIWIYGNTISSWVRFVRDDGGIECVYVCLLLLLLMIISTPYVYMRSFTKKPVSTIRFTLVHREFSFTNAYADHCTFLANFPTLYLPINYDFRGALSENVRFVLDFVLRRALGRRRTKRNGQNTSKMAAVWVCVQVRGRSIAGGPGHNYLI